MLAPESERNRHAAKLVGGILEDVADLAQIGKALAKKEAGEALRPFARMIACVVTATVLGFAGLIDLIHFGVAWLIRDDVGVSQRWLGWSAFALITLAALVGFIGTRRGAPSATNALAKGQVGPLMN